MSRSRRHNPILKDGGHSHKEWKRLSNRMARHNQEDLPVKGNRAHRAWARLYGRESIVEYASWMDFDDAVRAWEKEELEHASDNKPLHKRFVTKRRWLAWWKRHYLSK